MSRPITSEDEAIYNVVMKLLAWWPLITFAVGALIGWIIGALL